MSEKSRGKIAFTIYDAYFCASSKCSSMELVTPANGMIVPMVLILVHLLLFTTAVFHLSRLRIEPITKLLFFVVLLILPLIGPLAFLLNRKQVSVLHAIRQ